MWLSSIEFGLSADDYRREFSRKDLLSQNHHYKVVENCLFTIV